MRTRYDPETDAIYVGFTETPIVETEEVRPGVLLDFDAEGRIVAIEVLDASERLSAPAESSAFGGRGFDETAAPAPRKGIDADRMRSLTARAPTQEEDASTFLRAMRDGARY